MSRKAQADRALLPVGQWPGRADEPHHKDATVGVCHDNDMESQKAHVRALVIASNFAKHLKALNWRTPYQAICEAWTKDPSIFKINPHHIIPGPNTRV